jgi:hypothetical protein
MRASPTTHAQLHGYGAGQTSPNNHGVCVSGWESEEFFCRRWLHRVDGNHTEVQVTLESIGSNGVKYLTDAILRATKADNTDEKILTMHTQICAPRSDTIPTSSEARTIMLDWVIGTPELNCRWDELFVTVVDENGVYRRPVAI